MNDFIDIAIDTTSNLMETRPLTTNCYSSMIPTQKRSSSKRSRLNALKMKIDKSFSTQTFHNFRRAKNRGIAKNFNRQNNFSAMSTKNKSASLVIGN